MLPYIKIGSFSLPTYYTFMFLGYVAMVVFMMLPARRKLYGIGKLKAFLFATAVLFCGLLGCKILYVIETWPETLENGLTLGGFSFFGAALFVPLLMILFGFAFRMKIRDTLDNCAINVLAMLGTIRIGCFLNGCCGGRPIEMFGRTVTFPTQIIEAILDIGVLVWLLTIELRGEKSTRGTLYPLFLTTYGVYRFVIEFLRDTPKDWLKLSHGQWFSIIAVAAGIVWLALKTRSAKAQGTSSGTKPSKNRKKLSSRG
ncbi:MAG: prolipoprotein diacylglyceryl transferase [Clostridia bacterium]|nr:prolipoprotein diacylglyceryl transferase [Clostridia bacterium]